MTATYNRAQILQQRALPSILAQQIEAENFEWIVVNDGADPETTQILRSLRAPFPIIHLPIAHPKTGFGLCHARNLGLRQATGELIAYLDDDNILAPEFTAQTLRFFQQHPHIHCSMVQQRRRRDSDTATGSSFISPSITATATELIRQKVPFDSNGFVHRKVDCPWWNPEFRIFCDYEYFLQCLEQWGHNAFTIHPRILVNYVQTTAGIIGQSRYGQWADELRRLCQNAEDYPAIQPHQKELQQLADSWQAKGQQVIAGFKRVC
ncbi:glycosyltransferase family A protein [Sphaerothrix gracilis]|uniref:glycosyltransferase family A protein n=1 Tax=Sphaerothrix gracilis TaxID=3151835 RepID=UPI0031FC5EBF